MAHYKFIRKLKRSRASAWWENVGSGRATLC